MRDPGWSAKHPTGRRHSAHRPGTKRPPWWPEGEQWPPRTGPGSQAWTGFGRRLARLALVWLVLVVVVPLVIGVALAATIGGWTSVVVALVSWAGLAVVLVLAMRLGLRSWRPVRSLVETAGRLADGDYTARADDASQPPIRRVIESFNDMADRLESTELERRRLLADVGHEIRTPLTIIRGELEAIADGVRQPDEATLRRLLDDIDVMERLLDDLSTLSTAEAGTLTIHREPIEVVGLVQSVVHGLRSDAGAKGVELSHRASSEEIDATLDPVRLREIVANIVANALRATPSGGRVDVAIDSADRDVTIAVTDTGRGIPSDELDAVFQRFHKGVDSTGSGLGLTISRNLARAQGGDITLTSRAGEGTVATIVLPRDEPPPGAQS